MLIVGVGYERVHWKKRARGEINWKYVNSGNRREGKGKR